ncbi:hypothetical protein IKP94_01525 [Candidatus Saccharibacteria bacterium]|nr:hypothetical protein [Candidatus Saccharibacteria bacterium]
MPKEEEFLGINVQGQIIGVSALLKMLRKIDGFCAGNNFESQLIVSFRDGADCVAANIEEIIGFLKKERTNIENIDMYYENKTNSGRYVVKSTTIAALKCEISDEKFVVSARSADRGTVDFESLLDDLKSTIEHLPKKYDKLMRDRYKAVLIIGAAIGIWAALLVTALPMLDVRGRDFYVNNIIIYLLVTLFMTVVLGALGVILFVIPLYVELLSGSQNQESCDVTIGKKVNFAKYRKIIAKLDYLANRLLVAGVIVLLLVPILMIWFF